MVPISRRTRPRSLHPVRVARRGACYRCQIKGSPRPEPRPAAFAGALACARAVEVPIVGVGGGQTGQDALELIAVGASVVSLGTILFTDPAAPTRVREELRDEVTARGYSDPLEVRGIANS